MSELEFYSYTLAFIGSIFIGSFIFGYNMYIKIIIRPYTKEEKK